MKVYLYTPKVSCRSPVFVTAKSDDMADAVFKEFLKEKKDAYADDFKSYNRSIEIKQNDSRINHFFVK